MGVGLGLDAGTLGTGAGVASLAMRLVCSRRSASICLALCASRRSCSRSSCRRWASFANDAWCSFSWRLRSSSICACLRRSFSLRCFSWARAMSTLERAAGSGGAGAGLAGTGKGTGAGAGGATGKGGGGGTGGGRGAASAAGGAGGGSGASGGLGAASRGTAAQSSASTLKSWLCRFHCTPRLNAASSAAWASSAKPSERNLPGWAGGAKSRRSVMAIMAAAYLTSCTDKPRR